MIFRRRSLGSGPVLSVAIQTMGTPVPVGSLVEVPQYIQASSTWQTQQEFKAPTASEADARDNVIADMLSGHLPGTGLTPKPNPSPAPATASEVGAAIDAAEAAAADASGTSSIDIVGSDVGPNGQTTQSGITARKLVIGGAIVLGVLGAVSLLRR